MSKQKQIILNDLVGSGIPERTARYIVSVSAFETGDWSSRIYRKNNNLFGMKLPKIRKTTATGEQFGHATYTSTKQSVKDFVYYLESMSYPAFYSSLFEFVALMHMKGYFEADFNHYYNGVQSKHTKHFKQPG